MELGTRNPRVRVNCVLPGPVMLPPDLPEAERREAIAATLVKREGSPENVALAVLALVDERLRHRGVPARGRRTHGVRAGVRFCRSPKRKRGSVLKTLAYASGSERPPGHAATRARDGSMFRVSRTTYGDFPWLSK